MTKPNVSCRAVIVQDQKILLVNGDGSGDFWSPPGGRMDYAENLVACVKREAYEETGLTVAVGDAFAVSEFLYPANSFHNVDIFFRCTVAEGELTEGWVDTGGPVSERKFFSLDELQDLNVFPRFLRSGTWLKENAGVSVYHGQDVKE